MGEWSPLLSRLGKPRYLAIADAIAEDISSGKLAPLDRLPPQRKLARRLNIDFTTVARGYVEAQKRGLIKSRVGQGTFVRAPAKRRHGPIARHPEIVDLSMNLPPEPDDPELLDRMQDGLEAIGRDLVYLMRYQGFGGVQVDKDAASHWLRHRMLVPQQDRLFIAPGASRPAWNSGRSGQGRGCVSVRIAHISGRAFDRRPIRLAARRNSDGRRGHRCRRFCRRLPTSGATRALSQSDAAQSDDAHDLAKPPPGDHRHRAPVWCRNRRRRPLWLLAGRRAGAVCCARAGHHLARRWAGQVSRRRPADRLRRRAGCSFRLVVCVIGAHRDGDGFAGDHRAGDALDHRRHRGCAARRGAARIVERQKLATAILPRNTYRADPLGFHLWLSLPEPWTRSAFVGHTRSTGVSVVASDAFVTGGAPPEAVRVCLGGPADRSAVRSALEFMAHALARIAHPDVDFPLKEQLLASGRKRPCALSGLRLQASICLPAKVTNAS